MNINYNYLAGLSSQSVWLPLLLKQIPDVNNLVDETRKRAKVLFGIVIAAAILLYVIFFVSIFQIIGMSYVAPNGNIVFQPLVYWTAPIFFSCCYVVLEIAHWTLQVKFYKLLKKWEKSWEEIIKNLQMGKINFEDSNGDWRQNKIMLFTIADVQRRTFLIAKYTTWFGSILGVSAFWQNTIRMRNYAFYLKINESVDNEPKNEPPKLPNKE